MANYIQTLQAERDRAQRECDALQHGLQELLAHIEGPKFHGADAQWISTVDLHRMVRRIQAAAYDAADNETGG